MSPLYILLGLNTYFAKFLQLLAEANCFSDRKNCEKIIGALHESYEADPINLTN